MGEGARRTRAGCIPAARRPIPVEPFAARLPKANLGRGCIRFKRIDDIDLTVIDEVVRAAAAFDGKRVVHGVAVD